ncbi:serine/threonine protein phosphatase 2A 57 kDa regulatory subunit B' beta isoform-like [Quercus robur]|uniref:serine/threonine protein phosphatase 2A 57 kDa regulatory subunit B' beta isoform-like n=1 Tax=Quercus robur TaxID=38942 RepID=UPI002162C6A9|nr:serine/threonine protein phosphatase 2A 57 kDa regulatory subunit B' beta isoform-like [Quercus robur]
MNSKPIRFAFNLPPIEKMGAQRKTLQDLFNLESYNMNRIKHGSITSRPSFSNSINEGILSIISHCTFIFTFTDPLESPSKQDLKRVKLTQLLSILKSSKKLQDQILAPLMSMLSTNLFRPLPPPSNPSISSDLIDDEDSISSFPPTWSHLQIVYDILLRLVINMDPETLRNYVNHPFLLNLLSLFRSEDPRERESLKNVYHRIYSRFTFYRSFMRKSMNDVFLHYIFEKERHCGIGDLLEIWGTLINGFTVPLKEEHKLFLMRVLIPLHKTKGMHTYHRQLAYCVSQFVQKEPVLGGVVFRGILRYWPVTNCQKEILLLEELEELVENINPDQYRKLALPLCTQITKCSNSWNSQVAERALFVWNNEHFVKMATLEIEEVFPIVVEGVERNLKWHWSKSVRQFTEIIKEMLENLDSALYSKCLQEIDLREYRARQEEIKRREKWERIEMAAK